MRQNIVVANWKMNGTRQSIAALCQDIVANFGDITTEVAICPPFPYLTQVKDALQKSTIKLGAQNISEHQNGAFTGEVSATMLKDLATHYVIIGHSERRTLYHESPAVINAKIQNALNAQLTPIVCVGENLEQREQGRTNAVINAQIASVIDSIDSKDLASIIIAYEPIWAIGTGQTASPDEAQTVHQLIRAQFAKFDGFIAQKMPILYGGSVTPDNAKTLFACADIDGGLIGGASLNANSFIKICHSFR